MGWNDREPYASMIERRMTEFAQADADAAYLAAVDSVVDDMLEAELKEEQ